MGPPTKQRTFLGHPIGLYFLFFTEMWERFSYYGMRGLLILYMVYYFKWTQKDASEVYKWYTSLVYLTPMLGGYLADRFLGNKRAVIIGAILMAIGHFLMAFEQYSAFFSALIFLIFGNGFFKPNMSTQVGRLYPPNDPRRDGAYTIFYMGINLGAFMSPLVCGWLAYNTVGRFHSGFTMAGIGMVSGLLIYLVGQPWILEIDQTVPQEPTTESEATDHASDVLSETAAQNTPSVFPTLNRFAPVSLYILGGLLVIGGILGGLFSAAARLTKLAFLELIAWDTAVIMAAGGGCLLMGAWILSKTHNAVRDRVLAIYALAAFVMAFWAVFEQAGNPLNLWAEQATNRYVTKADEPPPIFPEMPAEKSESKTEPETSASSWQRWTTMFKPLPKPEKKPPKSENESPKSFFEKLEGWVNPIPTTWFQSINACAIFVLAPFFAALWTYLARHNMNPSIPTKMALGVLLMGLSFAVMVGAAKEENKPTTVAFKGTDLPSGVALNEQNQLCHADKESKPHEPYQAGRLKYDPATHTFRMSGVLADIERDRIVRDTAPSDFVKKAEQLQKGSAKIGEEREKEVHVTLDKEPPGFDMRYAGFKQKDVNYDRATKTLTSRIALADKDRKALLVAAGEPELRDTLNELMVESSRYRVSPWWLFWSYILATLGELCLSPVGLSMVSKLAPAKFATMLMGLWMLTSFFGNYIAGAFGEIWGVVAPVPFFLISVAALGVASLILFVLTRKIVAIMHGVN